jgi:hypothetical protein
MPTVPDLMESQPIRPRVRPGQRVAPTAGTAPGCAHAKLAIRKRAADGEAHQVVAPHRVQGKVRAPIDTGAQGAQARVPPIGHARQRTRARIALAEEQEVPAHMPVAGVRTQSLAAF